MAVDRLAVIGIGLIGGSFALAAKERRLVRHVVGVARSQHTRDAALECGAADEVTDDAATAVRGADLVYISAPVGATEPIMRAIAPHLSSDTLVTDAGSTKVSVMAHANALLAGHCVFIGGHPVAGSEQSGPSAATADLFIDRTYILTSAPDTPADRLDWLRKFIAGIGARVIICDADQHDQLVAATSHLPHLLAAALSGALADLAPRSGDLRLFSGTGLRDTTRVAGGPSDVWRDIFLDNRDNIRPPLEAFRARIDAFLQAMADADGDALCALLDEAREFREGLNDQ